MKLGPTYYDATANPAPQRAQLDGPIEADVCIIGGGYTGLSAALHLGPHARVVLLEAGAVGAGASGRNGGQIHTGQRQDQEDLEHRLGEAHARQLWDHAEAAKALVRQLIADHGIDCDLRNGLIHAAWKPGDAEPLRRSAEHLANRYGYRQTWIPKSEMPSWVQTDRYHGGTFDPGGGHLHALNFARGLAHAAEQAGATIYEHSAATSLEDASVGVTVGTASGRVQTQHVILAADTWLNRLDAKAGGYALPINSFVAVTAPLGPERAHVLIPSGAAVADTKFVVDYYRLTADHRLLFGGGETYTPKYPSDLKAFVAKPLQRVFPQLADVPLEYAWGGPVGVTLSRLPHLGRSGANTLFAHGFSGQGVALATLAGKLMADAIQGHSEGFEVFAKLKHRPFPGGAAFRTPLMALGMAWYALKDRL